jgi:hypothetical protein
MTPWEDAWLNGKLMPPHKLPNPMLIAAEAIAEEWLLDAGFRSILEEWVDRARAEDAIIEILWSGCRLRGEQTKRVAPLPVLVRILHSVPHPTTLGEHEDRMIEYRRFARKEWIAQYQKYGERLESAL